jgi:hypothetical protein
MKKTRNYTFEEKINILKKKWAVDKILDCNTGIFGKEKKSFYNLSKKKRKSYSRTPIGNIKAAWLIVFTTSITVFILVSVYLLIFYTSLTDTYKIALTFGLLVFVSNFTSKTYLYAHQQ